MAKSGEHWFSDRVPQPVHVEERRVPVSLPVEVRPVPSSSAVRTPRASPWSAPSSIVRVRVGRRHPAAVVVSARASAAVVAGVDDHHRPADGRSAELGRTGWGQKVPRILQATDLAGGEPWPMLPSQAPTISRLTRSASDPEPESLGSSTGRGVLLDHQGQAVGCQHGADLIQAAGRSVRARRDR